jgi:trimeric autotransporter adhesin
MFVRSPWKLLLLVGFALTLAGCTNNLVDSIVIAPSTQTLAVGQTVQFTATGYQSHGTHPSTSEIVTNQCAWSSSAPSIVSISSTGLATAVSAGTATIGASMQGFGGVIGNTATVTVTASGSISAEPLASMAIDPGSQTALAVNQTLNFIAIGTTGSGATVNLTGQSATVGSATIKAATWTSSNPAIASVNPSTGIATALTSGTTTITAQAINPDGTVVIGNATLTVTLPTSSAEPLVSMALIPGTQTLTSANQPADFIAIGTTGTGTTINLTNKVVWTSSSPTVASIGVNTGVATALSNGTTAITAVATNPDGTVVTGVGSVTVNISATAEPLVSLSIVPASQTASVVNQTAQFIAIGTTSSGATVNLTNQSATVGSSTIGAAVWGSSSTTVATINPATGLATAVSSGVVAITAQVKNPDGTVVTGTATFSVTSTTEPLVSLTIVPGTQTLVSEGQTAQYIAIGTTSSGATVNLTNAKATIGSVTINAATWGSSSSSVAAINPLTGVATAGTSGLTVITAVAYNPDGTAVTGTATLNVNIGAAAEPLVSLAIIPVAQTTSVVGQTVQFIALGTTSAGTTVNLTNQTASVNGVTINAAVWGSSSTAVATINPATGLGTAVSSGAVAITAQAQNPDGTVVTGTATFTVSSTPEPLVSLAIVPATQTLVSAGETEQYIVIGTTSTGATVNLTNAKATVGPATISAATWASSTPSVATINPATGVATAVTSGVAVITAVAYNPDGTAVTGTATLTVSLSATPEPLVSLSIVPASQTASVVGQTAQFIAIGTTANGTTVNLTNQPATVNGATINAAAWGSSSNAIATVNPVTGVATAVSAGAVAITAQAKNPDGTVVTAAATYTVITTPEPLVALSIVPAAQALSAAGQSAQFIAIGTTASGATVNLTNQAATIGSATIAAATWLSSDTSVAPINAITGLATVPAGAVNGVTVITAAATNPDGTTVTAAATLTVNITSTPEPLVSLSIVPAAQTTTVVGQPAQFIAIGTTSSGTTVNLTNQAATIGSATIAAATWGSSSSAVATVNPATGLATAVSSGTVAITAQAKNPDGTVVTGIATLTVNSTPEPLVSLTIVPNSQTLTAAGQPAQFIAIGTTSSGATVNLTNVAATIGTATINAAVWGSSSMSVATINPATALATAGTSGTTVITAIAHNPDGTAVTGTATLTVSITPSPEPLVSLAIVPASQTAFAINQTAQFIAIGTTSSGTTVNLTNQSAAVGGVTIAAASWITSNPAVASVNAATGVATALSAGSAAITAIAKNPDGSVVTGTAVYTVTVPNVAEPLVSMTLTPSSQTIAGGQTASLTAIATTGTGTSVNLTNQPATVGTATILAAVFNSSVPGVATVNPGTGVVTAISPGVTVITAIASNPDGTVVTGVATITVSSTGGSGGAIAAITIIPSTQAVPAPNATAQYIAIGTTTNGATVNLTNQVAWSSSSAQIGTIGASTGLATGVGQGSATITALYTPVSGNVITGTAQFAVSGGTTEEYTAVTLIPNALSLAVGQTSQFVALGTLGTSGLIVDVTDSPQITWTSDAVSLATVNSTGLVTGQNTGNPTITVELKNPDGTLVSATADVTVSTTTAPEPLVSLTIIPSSLTVGSLQGSGQFLAIGTFSVAPYVRDLTNSPTTTWISSFPDYFPVDTNSGGTPSATAGIVTAYDAGSATIIAESANPDGTIQTATATFNCPLQLPSPDSIPPLAGTCYTGQVGPLKSTLTIYGEGLETNSTWLVTASSATNTPDVIHCGPGWPTDGISGGSVCVAIYPVTSTVILTATQDPSTTGTFGGWTYNCTPSDVNGVALPGPIFWTAAGPNYCTISLDGTNATVGAIFN